MKTKINVLAALLLCLAMQTANATEAGTFLMRSRAILIAPSVKTDSLAIDVKTQGTPEFDFSYFFAKNISAELILGMARHDVGLSGGHIGSVNVLPPTVLAQYHFGDMISPAIDPYLGAGINYTFFFNSNLPVDLNSGSFGPALQVGADIPIKGDIFINVDLKKIWIKSDVKTAGTSTVVDTLKIDPMVYGLGIGFKL